MNYPDFDALRDIGNRSSPFLTNVQKSVGSLSHKEEHLMASKVYFTRTLTPEKVLERIQVGNSIWCLVKFPESAVQDE